MTQNEIKNVRLFGFKINSTIAVILIYIIFPIMLNLFPILIYYGFSLIEYPPLDLFANPLSFLYITLYIVIPILLIPLFIYIFVVCIMARKISRAQEVSKVRWFCFRLNNTSLVVLFILSVFNLLFDIQALFSYIGNLITFLGFSYYPQIIVIQIYSSIIINLITMGFFIYTLIVCAMNRRLLR
jgi:hypothetical protein